MDLVSVFFLCRINTSDKFLLIFRYKLFNSYCSNSQPGCRCTQGCRQEVSEVPQNIEFSAFFNVVLHKVPWIVIMVKGAAKYF